MDRAVRSAFDQSFASLEFENPGNFLLYAFIERHRIYPAVFTKKAINAVLVIAAFLCMNHGNEGRVRQSEFGFVEFPSARLLFLCCPRHRDVEDSSFAPRRPCHGGQIGDLLRHRSRHHVPRRSSPDFFIFVTLAEMPPERWAAAPDRGLEDHVACAPVDMARTASAAERTSSRVASRDAWMSASPRTRATAAVLVSSPPTRLSAPISVEIAATSGVGRARGRVRTGRVWWSGRRALISRHANSRSQDETVTPDASASSVASSVSARSSLVPSTGPRRRRSERNGRTEGSMARSPFFLRVPQGAPAPLASMPVTAVRRLTGTAGSESRKTPRKKGSVRREKKGRETKKECESHDDGQRVLKSTCRAGPFDIRTCSQSPRSGVDICTDPIKNAEVASQRP